MSDAVAAYEYQMDALGDELDAGDITTHTYADRAQAIMDEFVTRAGRDVVDFYFSDARN